jgi:hypothetical protein
MSIQLETPPCEEFNCEFFKVCQQQSLACRGFADFVRLGESAYDDPGFSDKLRNPDRVIYRRLFPTDIGE